MEYLLPQPLALMRQDAVESELFYRNRLADKQFQKKYFPIGLGSSTYDQRPKLAFPFTNMLIERLVNLIHFGQKITIDNQAVQKKIDELYENLNFSQFSRDILLNTLVGGNNLSVIRIVDGKILLENWKAPYLRWESSTSFRYEFESKDGLMFPIITTAGLKEENITSVLIDSTTFGEVVTGFDFPLAVWTRNCDRYEEPQYGQPYTNRFKDLNVRYNQVASDMLYSLLMLRNVWVTNASFEQTLNPIRLDVDRINFLGQGIELKQVTRELNLEEDRQMLATLRENIFNSAQVPPSMIDLDDAGVGKIPSGVALQIVFQPLAELVTRLRETYSKTIIDLTKKIIRILNNNGDYQVNLILNKHILPQDRDAEINQILNLMDKNILTIEQVRQLIAPLMDIDL